MPVDDTCHFAYNTQGAFYGYSCSVMYMCTCVYECKCTINMKNTKNTIKTKKENETLIDHLSELRCIRSFVTSVFKAFCVIPL